MPPLRDEFDIYNDTSDDIPAGGLALWSGGFTPEGALKVVKPTADSQPSLVAVGSFAVPAKSTGTGSFSERCELAYDPAGGTPAQGDSLGSQAGSWYALKGNTGFVCYGGPAGPWAACVRGTASPTTTTTSTTTTTTTTTTTVSPTTTTTTTTTTAGPCSGRCKWTFDHAAKTWSLTSSTCSAGCYCLAPTYCPPDSGADSCTYTDCARTAGDGAPPNCTGTTTTGGPECTTTTAGPPPECADGCDWFCHPARGWVQTSNGCSAGCPCPAPSTPCVSACDETSTACQVTTTQSPYCSGGCRWVWVTPSGVDPYWLNLSSDCAGGGGVANCYCDAPAAAGTACAQEASTPCYAHGADGPTPGPCDPGPTTTTPGPGCSAPCLWGTSDGIAWDVLLRPCPGDCLCQQPPSPPADACEQVEQPCANPTTTTTTTTTTAGPTTTTTTTTPCPTVCYYGCADTPDRTDCVPVGTSCYDWCADRGGCAFVGGCRQDCDCTTTTAGPTTTTTTTAGAGWYCCDWGSCATDCTGLGGIATGPYADASACAASGCADSSSTTTSGGP